MQYCCSFKKLLLIAACAVLASCGGGGGNTGGGSSSGADVNTAGLSIAADKSSLAFVTLNGTPSAASDVIRFSLNGGPANATYYAKVESDNQAIFNTTASQNLTSMTVNISTTNVTGNVDGKFVFKLCNDANCASVAWSRTIPYSIRPYKIDASPISITAFQGGQTSLLRNLGHKEAASDLTIRAYADNGSKWLSSQIDGEGRLQVSVDGTGMPRGRFNGTVWLGAKSMPGISLQIQVIADIGAGADLPANRSLDFDASSPSVIDSTFDLTYQGGQSPAWTAYSDKPWLTLGSLSGQGSSKVAYRIDGSKLADVPNFTSDTAKLTFKSAGLDDIVYSITLSKKLPEVITSSPYLLHPSVAGEVRLRGRGFLQLGSITRVKMQGAQITSGNIVSDTEIVLNLPGLAIGRYPITFELASNLTAGYPGIFVASAEALPAAMLDNVGDKKSIAFSPPRNAFYVVNADRAVLQQYVASNGAWSLAKSMPVSSGARLGLTVDQQILYTTNGSGLLEARSPDTLEVTATYKCEKCTQMYRDYMWNGLELPITADGRVWLSTSQWSDLMYFDPRTKSFITFNPARSSLRDPKFTVSGDGSRMIVSTESGGNGESYRYDPLDGQMVMPNNAPPYDYGTGIALSGNGKYVLTGATDYFEVADYRRIGRLPSGTGGYYQPALASYDGSLIYASATQYGQNTGTNRLVRLDVIRTSDMTKIGEIPLPTGVSECPTSTTCNYRGALSITPSSNTIIWAGNKKIAVIPIPRDLAQKTPTAARLNLGN